MTDTNTECFVDGEELRENTAKFNFEDNAPCIEVFVFCVKLQMKYIFFSDLSFVISIIVLHIKSIP